MKRLFSLIAFVCLTAVPVHAQMWLKQSTATTINFHFTTIADGTDTASATITNITISFIAQSDTLSSSTTNVTAAVSGSANDCVYIIKGMYNCEITAANTGTLGRFDAVAALSGSYSDPVRFQVLPAGTYDLLVATGPSTVPTNFADLSITASTGRVDVAKVSGTTQTAGDIPAVLALHDTMPRATAYSNFPVWIMSNSTGAGIASLTNITCRISKDGGAWATTNDTTETEVGGSGNGRGMYLIDLTGTEMTADVVAVECVSATANTSIYRTSLTTQH